MKKYLSPKIEIDLFRFSSSTVGTEGVSDIKVAIMQLDQYDAFGSSSDFSAFTGEETETANYL